MLACLKGLDNSLATHGFRSAFRDWAAEATHHPNHVVEMALAHAIGNAVEAAYRRGDLLAKRRKLMNDMSDNAALQEAIARYAKRRRWTAGILTSVPPHRVVANNRSPYPGHRGGAQPTSCAPSGDRSCRARVRHAGIRLAHERPVLSRHTGAFPPARPIDVRIGGASARRCHVRARSCRSEPGPGHRAVGYMRGKIDHRVVPGVGCRWSETQIARSYSVLFSIVPPLLEQVAAPVSCFDLVPDSVRERHFDHVVRIAGALGGPIPEC